MEDTTTTEETITAQFGTEESRPEMPPEPQVEAPPSETDGTLAETDESTASEDVSEDTGETPAGAEAAPIFNPSLKYKVRDEEHTMDEWVKDFVKDEETEKRFRDLYTRGHGLDLAKKERDEAKTEYDKLQQALGVVNDYVKSGDAHGFIETLGLPKEMFIKYAIDQLKYNEMTPEQRAEVDGQRAQMNQLQQLQYQNQQLQQNFEQQATQQKEYELNASLADPSVATIANEYDSKVGKPGAFRALVIERGTYHDYVHQKDISAQQAVQEVIQIIGGNQGTVATPQEQTQVGTPQVAQQQKKVIPNIQGQGTVSPTKKAVTSVQDLRDRYKSMQT